MTRAHVSVALKQNSCQNTALQRIDLPVVMTRVHVSAPLKLDGCKNITPTESNKMYTFEGAQTHIYTCTPTCCSAWPLLRALCLAIKTTCIGLTRTISRCIYTVFFAGISSNIRSCTYGMYIPIWLTQHMHPRRA